MVVLTVGLTTGAGADVVDWVDVVVDVWALAPPATRPRAATATIQNLFMFLNLHGCYPTIGIANVP